MKWAPGRRGRAARAGRWACSGGRSSGRARGPRWRRASRPSIPELVWFSAHFWAEALFIVLLCGAFERAGRGRRTAAPCERRRGRGPALRPRGPDARDRPLLPARSPRSGSPGAARGRRRAARRSSSLAAVLLVVALDAPQLARLRRVRARLHRGRAEPLAGQHAPLAPGGVRGVLGGARPHPEVPSTRASGRARPILERQPLWIFEKLRDEMPEFWEADAQPIVHIERGAYGVVRPAARARGGAPSCSLPYLAVLALFVAGLAFWPSRPSAAPAPGVPRSTTSCCTWPPTATRAIGCPRCPRSSSWPRTASWPCERGPRPAADRTRLVAAAAAGSRPRALGRAEPRRLDPQAVAAPVVRGAGRRAGAGRRGRRGAGGPMSPWRAIPLALLLAVVVRVPFWIEALQTPVDGDTAIVGLMARHPGVGTTLWGQPYGSPLDAWVATPFVAHLGLLGRGAAPAVLPARPRPRPARLRARRASSTRARRCRPRCSSPVRRPTSCCSRPCPRRSTPRPSCSAAWCCSPAARAGRRAARGRREPRRGGRCCCWGCCRASRSGRTSCRRASWRRPRCGCCVRSRGPAAAAGAGRRAAAGARARPLDARAPRRRGDAHRAGRRPRTRRRSQHLAAVLPRLHEPLGGVLGTHVPVVADAEDFMLAPPRLGRGAHRAALRRCCSCWPRGPPRRAARRCSSSLAAALALARLPVPRALGPAHDPLADPALPARWRRSWRGRPRRGAAPRRAWAAGAGPRRAAPGARARGCSSRGAAPTGPRRRSRSPDLRPVRRACSTRTACATPTRPTARRSASPGRAASGSWPRRPGTTASATGRCRYSTRCASRRTWPGS